MGLDQYANLYRAEDAAGVSVDIDEAKSVGSLFYWRKHPNLQGWMKQLYHAKGGQDEGFNTNTVRLDSEDLDALEEAVNGGKLPHTEGFFFGESQPEHADEDRQFLKLARAAIAEGYVVFYDSWW
ncbi:MAG: phosphoglycerate kinase [Acetobacteraceae bacterium]|nr:phosphoglycerate kinase [Acetobacteraceae bacterium]